MKKIFFVLLVAGMTQACKKAIKDPNDVIPELEMVSANVEADSSVTVVGKVISTGVFQLQYGGFCCSDEMNPEINENQLHAVTYEEPYLTAVYDNLTWGETYFIKAWCANGELYGASADFQITVE